MLRSLPLRPSALARIAFCAGVALTASVLAGSGGVLYDKGFENPPFAAGVGTVFSPKWVGTDGWTMVANPSTVPTASCYPFAGIDSNLVPAMGQTAALGYLGSQPPPNTTQFIRVGRKVDTEPVVTSNLPIIDFYCQLGLTQSTNSHHDDFELLIYNWDEKVLGGLTFDLTQGKLFRYDANEFNTGSTDSPYTDTGLSLASNGTAVEVTMRINYKTNTWSATVGGVQVFNGAPFTRRPISGVASPAARTFGSVSARWYITTVGYPGNNWMLLDEWSINAYAEPSIPATASAGHAANATATIAVTDPDSVGWTLSSNQAWAVVSPSSGSGNGTVTVTCALNAAAVSRTATITAGTQTCLLTQTASPYAVCAAGLPAGLQGFYQDADQDGVGNGMEYALGRNAANASGMNGLPQLPAIIATGTGSVRHLAMTASLPEPAPADMTYDVQVSNNLTGSWTNIMEKIGTGPWTVLGNSAATLASSPAGSGRTSVTITDTQGHHFMRLAVMSSAVPIAVTTVPSAASALHTANSTATIQVTSNTTWAASSDRTWALVSPSSGTGNGTVTVTCAANAGLARTASITIGGQTCLLTQAGAPFALWAVALPPGQQGFEQDADGDGVTNGFEYGFGRSATSAVDDNGVAQLPVFTWTGSGASRHPALAINLPSTVPADLSYDVEVSNTLSGSWTTILNMTANGPWTVIGASGATVSSAAAGPGRTLHTVTDAQARHFLRLKITKTP